MKQEIQIIFLLKIVKSVVESFVHCHSVIHRDHKRRYASAMLDTAQHWPRIGKNVVKDRLPISRRCWNDNSGMHLATNSVPNSGFLTSRMVCRGKSDTWLGVGPKLGQVSADGQ